MNRIEGCCRFTSGCLIENFRRTFVSVVGGCFIAATLSSICAYKTDGVKSWSISKEECAIASTVTACITLLGFFMMAVVCLERQAQRRRAAEHYVALQPIGAQRVAQSAES